MIDRDKLNRMMELNKIPYHELTPDEIVESALLNLHNRANFVPSIDGQRRLTRVILDMRERIEQLEAERTDIVALKKRIEKLEKEQKL